MIEIATTGFWMHDEMAADLGEGFRLHKLWSMDALTAQAGDQSGIRAIFAYSGAIPINRDVMEALPALELIVVMGAGTDIVDHDAALARGVAVRNCPAANTDDVAELAMGLMLAAGRGIAAADAAMRDGKWINRTSHRLSGRKLGIFGMGSIGRAIARRAAAFDMSVSYSSRSVQPNLPYQHLPTVQQLAEAVDVLVLAAPATDATYHIVDARVLDALGPDGILVNIARGTLVDEPALVAALSEGRLGAAGLDVFEHEPDFPAALRELPNVVLSPHNGGNTYQAFSAVRAKAVSLMRAHFEGAMSTEGRG